MMRTMALHQVETELVRAVSKFPAMQSAHEGWAVIKEELDELWDEVKKKEPSRSNMAHEATQVAAMAIRFLMDVCDGSTTR